MSFRVTKSVILLLLFFKVSFNDVLTAQEAPVSVSSSALGVSPAITELVLEPGKPSEVQVIVYNVTNTPLPIKSFVKSFIANEKIIEEDENEVFDASTWIMVEPSDFILQPKEEKEIILAVTPPDNVEPGGHYATVLFQPLIPEEYISSNSANLTAQVGVLTLFIVKGNIVERAELSNFATDKFRQFGPVQFDLMIQNKGNVHILPSGKISIRNMWDKQIDELEINPKTILPKTERELSATWDKKFLLGKYTAAVQVLYGTENLLLGGQEISFWIIPWLPLLGGFVTLTLIAIFLIMIRKNIVPALEVLFGKKLTKKRKER